MNGIQALFPNEGMPLLLLTVVLLAGAAYLAYHCTYLLYFHPLASFPGPRIAAVSNTWYTYHWLSGRYPWATEKVLKSYGDVVRIAPNELLFFTPEAFADIYSPHVKNHETFHKTDINNRGDKHGGLLFEQDPVRHRRVAKQVAPAFSSRSTRAKEPRLHKYIDAFVSKMRAFEGDGVDVSKWCNWLAMDISADMAYNREMNQMKDMKNSAFLNVLLGFNAFTTIDQVSKRFSILGRLKYLFIPFSSVQSMKEMNQTSREELQRRIEKKGDTENLDFFEQLVPAGRVVPSDPEDFRHLEQVATQLLFAGFEPVSAWIYSTLFQLVNHEECLNLLTGEIRQAFSRYDDISPAGLARLDYLNACLEESMRLLPSNNTGLPRVSPGATVDGTYVPPGVTVQTSMFATTRSPRYFHDPLHFDPRRWLNDEHPLYDPRFSEDRIRDVLPFSQGPRQCPGKDIAWTQVRLFVGKVLWTYDISQHPGKPLDFERDFITYGFWVKPELRIHFVAR
ncbi:putative cytochrome P450 [Rosellinia necatrix]|uniref:Putative cytochrome P450 n=1 Tax=Rosellinia necatrix TaxID=77044 RepID=A0A1W2TUC7_ROSNE|nr:putative cytochrome P450 [Rosellinia necatrix]